MDIPEEQIVTGRAAIFERPNLSKPCAHDAGSEAASLGLSDRSAELPVLDSVARAYAWRQGLTKSIFYAMDRFERGNKGATPLSPDPAPSAQIAKVSDLSDPQQRITALENMILARLDDDQAQDVVFIDLKGKSAVADALVVASGRSHRHVGAIADHLLRALKDMGYGKVRVEGMPHCDWVLIDTGDIIIHLFRPEVRTFYNIEKIWSVDAPTHIAFS